jgi:myo-inositol-1(or 4)-monophosphatase
MVDPLTFATQVAYEAGALLLEQFNSVALKTSLKADRSVVTEADLASDRMISQAIQEKYPGEMILSEELQTALRPADTLPATWIIDPLDGTTNFSLGLHIWGVLLARLVNGWPEIAVMYFPMINELYSARLGAGAFLNGQSIQVYQRTNRPLSFFACCSRTYRRYDVSVPYKTRILGSAGYTFCCVARGIALVGFEATPKIWDIAGSWLLVGEAGGVIKTLDESQPFPLKTDANYARLSFPTLAAATPDLSIKTHEQLRPKVAI